jgi:hypothetical protein
MATLPILEEGAAGPGGLTVLAAPAQYTTFSTIIDRCPAGARSSATPITYTFAPPPPRSLARRDHALA